MGEDQTVRRRSHEREASHWRGTLPYQTHLLTRTLVTRRRERQQRLTERQQTKQQNTQICLRRAYRSRDGWSMERAGIGVYHGAG